MFAETERQDEPETKVALSESEQRFRLLIDSLQDYSVFPLSVDGRVSNWNLGAERLKGYSTEEALGLHISIFFPEEENAERVPERILKRAEAEGRSEYEGWLLRKDGSRFWGTVVLSAMRDQEGRLRGFSNVARDVTERKKSEEALRESERLSRTVIEEVSENICLVDVETGCVVASNPAFREALGYTEDELRRMTLYDIVAHDRKSIERNMRRTVENRHTLIGERQYRRKDGSLLDVEASGSIILRGGRETICVVAHDITERARAQRLLEERVTTLSNIAATLAFDLPTEETLNTLAKSAVGASTAVACAVVLIDKETDVLHLFGAYGLPEGYTTGLQEAYRAGVESPSLRAYRTREPVLVRDVRRFLLADPLYGPIHRFTREVPWDVTYHLPLISRRRALGAIFFFFLPEQEPGEDEQVFLKAIADQTAVALENARHFADARGKAALEERQRLARELHDSVSQALYGIALGTKTARKLVDQDPQLVADPLDYVLSLAEAGLAEMRALIFELRPESLETEGLVSALQKQAAALRARHEIEVEAYLCAEPEASPEAKEALYRIAQEALHNTVKHARASTVKIEMRCDPGHLTFLVSDDGVGFDPDGDFPGHLGLRSMRERAVRLGGVLEVDSATGKGTRIRVCVPIRQSDIREHEV